jgi:hypothetical protein
MCESNAKQRRVEGTELRALPFAGHVIEALVPGKLVKKSPIILGSAQAGSAEERRSRKTYITPPRFGVSMAWAQHRASSDYARNRKIYRRLPENTPNICHERIAKALHIQKVARRSPRNDVAFGSVEERDDLRPAVFDYRFAFEF